nr:DUF5994 family protein [Gordonia sp. SID5947]
MAPDLTLPIAGAWLPYTSQISQELPALQAAGRSRLGVISRIDVNWRNFARYPGLDSENSPDVLPLMSVTADHATVTLLVIPPRTQSALAATLLRQAGQCTTSPGSEHSHLYRDAQRILHRAALQCGAIEPKAAG